LSNAIEFQFLAGVFEKINGNNNWVRTTAVPIKSLLPLRGEGDEQGCSNVARGMDAESDQDEG